MLDTRIRRTYSVPVTKKAAKPDKKNWRPTVEDVKLLAELKAKLGVVNETDIIRQGLRKLAEAEGLR